MTDQKQGDQAHHLHAAIDAAAEPDRPLAVLRYLCDIVGSLDTRGITADSLQDVITEIHLTCLNVDPTLDPDDARYSSGSPSLLHEATDILSELVDTQPNNGLSARAHAVLERAAPIVNPATQPHYDDRRVVDSEDPG